MKVREADVSRMRDLRSGGATLASIGAQYGISQERVRQLMMPDKGLKPLTKQRSIYPYIDTWMRERRMGYVQFVAMMSEVPRAGDKYSLSRRLMGKSELRKRDIDGILRVIGEPYEVVFAEGGGADDDVRPSQGAGNAESRHDHSGNSGGISNHATNR
jgi:hypothetical protein